MIVMIAFQSIYSAIQGHKVGTPDPVLGVTQPKSFGVCAQARCPEAKTFWEKKQLGEYLARLRADGFKLDQPDKDHIVCRRTRSACGGALVIEQTLRIWLQMSAASQCVVERCIEPSPSAPIKLPHWRYGADPNATVPKFH